MAGPDLAWLGWDDGFRRAFAELALTGVRPGRVRRVDRGESDIVVADGEVRAFSDSVRAQGEIAPVTGDWVAVEPTELGPSVAGIVPRRTTLTRRDPAEAVTEQVLVANVDVVGVVCGVDRPCNLARIERFLVLAADGGAEAVVIVTKADLAPADPEWSNLADDLVGTRVLVTSAVDGRGLGLLHELVATNRTLVLLGESGSGKSTLVNALVGTEVQEVARVRHGDAKGRHTTTARELVPIPGGGILIDTPGIRGVGLWDARPALGRVYGDIEALGEGCRFRDCAHLQEPGCGVKEAVDRGDLDPRRLARYHHLVAELDDQDEAFEQQRRRADGRRRGGR